VQTKNELRVSLKLPNAHFTDVPFPRALGIILDASKADLEEYERFRSFEKDQWFVGFVSSCLTLADRPEESDWLAPKSYVRAAMADYGRGDCSGAKHLMESAVRACNATHKKLQEFFAGTTEGAERGQTLIEITNTILITAVAGEFEAASLLVRAGVGAGLKGYESFMTEGGKVLFDLEGKIDWGKITIDIAKTFAETLIIGKLAHQFKALLTPRITALITNRPALGKISDAVKRLAKAGKLPRSMEKWEEEAPEKLLEIAILLVGGTIYGVAQKLKGKELKTKEFVSDVLEELGNDEMEIIGKALKLF
jgi:hypothetical protein